VKRGTPSDEGLVVSSAAPAGHPHSLATDPDVITSAYPPGGPTATDRLLRGAIDLHHHGYPEMSLSVLGRMDDFHEFQLSRSMGLAAVVLKSHMWPTVGRAYLLNQMLPGIDIIPSITLNTIVGGFSPLAVECAALQGARVLFMPTWSAANDIENGGFSNLVGQYVPSAGKLPRELALRAVGPNGKVLPEVKECLAVAAEHGMLLCTAHISPTESLAVTAAARDVGIEGIVFSHPDSRSVGATPEHIRDMAELGACCEFCIIGMMPAYQRTSVKSILDTVAAVSASRVIITTDYFGEWFPPGAEMMRLAIGTLLAAGLSEEEIRQMVKTNPERLLAQSEVRRNVS
jgi:Family of unknown function (DUF6282)